MKNLTFLSAIFLCFITANLKSASSMHRQNDSLSCLKIEGNITNANEGVDGECTIELIVNNKTINTVVLKEGKRKFKFTLNKNSYYAIRITKKGYISKLVCINTELPVETDAIFGFQFDTQLIKDTLLQKLNIEVVDFPVAIIYFDLEKGCFDHNKEYSDNIKKELYASKDR